jgi:cold shock CspA family protein
VDESRLLSEGKGSSNVINERVGGVVTRLCAFKYGFIQTDDLRNIFFHFSELSDESKALVEEGVRVTFKQTINDWTADKKPKAISIEVVNSLHGQQQYKDKKGVVSRELGSKGYGFIQSDDVTYFFASTELVEDEVSASNGNTAVTGDSVIFDVKWSHQYNPPKPCAKNVRLVAPGKFSRSSSCTKRSTLQRSTSTFLPTTERISLHCAESGNTSPAVNSRAQMLRMSSPPKRLSRTMTLEEQTVECSTSDQQRPSFPSQRQSSHRQSIGSASLRVLVESLMKQGKTEYLVIRNELQTPEYLGRSLAMDEKHTITSILNQCSNKRTGGTPRQSQNNLRRSGSSKSGLHRQKSKRQSSQKKLVDPTTKFP